MSSSPPVGSSPQPSGSEQPTSFTLLSAWHGRFVTNLKKRDEEITDRSRLAAARKALSSPANKPSRKTRLKRALVELFRGTRKQRKTEEAITNLRSLIVDVQKNLSPEDPENQKKSNLKETVQIYQDLVAAHDNVYSRRPLSGASSDVEHAKSYIQQLANNTESNPEISFFATQLLAAITRAETVIMERQKLQVSFADHSLALQNNILILHEQLKEFECWKTSGQASPFHGYPNVSSSYEALQDSHLKTIDLTAWEGASTFTKAFVSELTAADRDRLQAQLNAMTTDETLTEAQRTLALRLVAEGDPQDPAFLRDALQAVREYTMDKELLWKKALDIQNEDIRMILCGQLTTLSQKGSTQKDVKAVIQEITQRRQEITKAIALADDTAAFEKAADKNPSTRYLGIWFKAAGFDADKDLLQRATKTLSEYQDTDVESLSKRWLIAQQERPLDHPASSLVRRLFDDLETPHMEKGLTLEEVQQRFQNATETLEKAIVALEEDIRTNKPKVDEAKRQYQKMSEICRALIRIGGKLTEEEQSCLENLLAIDNNRWTDQQLEDVSKNAPALIEHLEKTLSKRLTTTYGNIKKNLLEAANDMLDTTKSQVGLKAAAEEMTSILQELSRFQPSDETPRNVQVALKVAEWTARYHGILWKKSTKGRGSEPFRETNSALEILRSTLGQVQTEPLTPDRS